MYKLLPTKIGVAELLVYISQKKSKGEATLD